MVPVLCRSYLDFWPPQELWESKKILFGKTKLVHVLFIGEAFENESELNIGDSVSDDQNDALNPFFPLHSSEMRAEETTMTYLAAWNVCGQ